MEAEDDAGPGFVIKKRTKARPKKSTQGRSRVDEGPSTGATSSTSTTAAAAGDGDEDQQQEAAAESAVVRRHPQHKSSLRQQQTSKLAFGGDAATVSVKKRGGGGLRPALDLPADAETAAAPTASRYTAEDLSALKTATQTSNQLTQAKFGHLAAHQPSAQAPDEELIPTDNAIAAAKLKRDVLRKSGAHPSAQDYIALDHTASDLVLAGDKSGESRLMREEDELGEGDEDMAEYTGAQDRIAIGSKARQAAERNKRVGIQDLLEEAQDDLEDLEMRRWEDAQIRRSGHDMSLDVETKKSVSARIPINAALPTFNVVQSRLQAALEAAQTAQQYNQSLSDQSAQLESLRQQEAALRHQVTLTSERFEFFQAFQAWVEDDLVAFLDAKMPPLERLEKRNVEVQIERRHILGARRMTAHACELAGWTRRPVLSDYHALRKPRRPAAGCTSTGMAEDDDDDDDAEEPLPLQNFVSPMEATPVAVALSEAEASDLKAASEAMALEQDTILADVQAEDFRDPALGAAVQFKKWRQAYPEEYKLSFAGLVLVQVWEFWARLELARWNPFQTPLLHASPSSLEQLHSHDTLVQYAHETQEEENLFGALIANVVVPRLKEFAPAYDPFDALATTKVLSLVEEVTYGVEKSSDKFEDLVSAYMRQIQQVLFDLQQQVLPLCPLSVRPGPTLFGQDTAQFLENGMKWKRFARDIRFKNGRVAVGQRLEEGLVREGLEKVLLPVLQATGDSDSAKKMLTTFGKSFALTGPVAEALRQI